MAPLQPSGKYFNLVSMRPSEEAEKKICLEELLQILKQHSAAGAPSDHKNLHYKDS